MGFKNYLTEKVNDTNRLKHLSHLEDLIFEEGAVGLADAIEGLEIYVSILHKKTGQAKITTKWDGSPSIIIHNSGDDYWVASKSAFNANPKLNRTDGDIEVNHGHAPGLVEKLKYALKYCKKLGINGTVQGDFLYTEGDLQPATIDGVKYVTFKPNTIVYAVPVDSVLGRKILASKMGIIFHTSYSGSDPATMKATVGTYSVSKLKKTPEVFFDDALIKDGTADLSLSNEEQTKLSTIMARLRSLQKVLPAKFLNTLADHDQLAPLMAQYNNANVRAGDYTSPTVVNGFIPFIEGKFAKEIEKVKTEKTKQAKASVRDELTKFISDNHAKLTFAYEAYSLMVTAKMLIVSKLNKLATMKTFVQQGNSLKPTNPEGFVAVQDKRVVKLVDRLEFSRNNFLNKGE